MIDIRTLRPHQWPVLKEVRLAALADAPEAFTFPLARAQANTDADWEEFATCYATTKIAFTHDAPCGMIGAFFCDPLAGDGGPAAELAAVWVAPAQRRQGVGEAMIAAIIDWAVGHGVTALHAWVTQSSAGAIAFYERVGFVRTGSSEPDEQSPTGNTIQLVRRLAPQSG